MNRIRKFAPLSNQGTSMIEICLTIDEYENSEIRQAQEEKAKLIHDCSSPVVWAEVTENDAFYEGCF